MTKEQAIEHALHHARLKPGESATGATERYVEVMDDESKPGPIHDVRCWVVEFSGDYGPTVDLYVDCKDGSVVKRMAYA